MVGPTGSAMVLGARVGWLTLGRVGAVLLIALSGCRDRCADVGRGQIGLHPAMLNPIGQFQLEAGFVRDAGGSGPWVADLRMEKDGVELLHVTESMDQPVLVVSGTVRVASPGEANLSASISCGESQLAIETQPAEFLPVLVAPGMPISRNCGVLIPALGGYDCDGVVVNSRGTPEATFAESPQRRIAATDAGSVRWVALDGSVRIERPSRVSGWVAAPITDDWVATERWALVGTQAILDGRSGDPQSQPIEPIRELADGGLAHALFVSETDGGLRVTFVRDPTADRLSLVTQCTVAWTGSVWSSREPCSTHSGQVLGVDFSGAKLLATPVGGALPKVIDVLPLDGPLRVTDQVSFGIYDFFVVLPYELLQLGVIANAWSFFEPGTAGGVIAVQPSRLPELVVPEGPGSPRASASLVWWTQDGGATPTHFAPVSDATIVRSR